MLRIERASASLLLLAASLYTATCGYRNQPSDAPLADAETEKKAVVQAMRDWADGFIMRDPVRLDRVRADDWVYSGDPSGAVVTKAQADKMFQADTSTRYSGFDYQDLNVRIYGVSAVVTGRENIRWESEGKPGAASYRFTAAFVKQQGQWRCVASHSSPITRK